MTTSPPVAPPALIVLDVNETLSDLDGLAPAFTSAGLSAAQIEPWFAGVLRDAFALSLTGALPSFSDIAVSSLRVRLAAADADPDAADDIMSALMTLAPHPDVVPALTRLAAAGIRLVTLSNGSADVARRLLADTPAGDVVEAYLSVEDAGVWKPAAGAYAYALRETGVAPEHAMLVAVHPWDVAGARAAGLRTAWVGRGGAHYPDHMEPAELSVDSLQALADLLC